MLLEKTEKTDVSLRETTTGRFLILLLPVWVWVQVSIFPHYFLIKKQWGHDDECIKFVCFTAATVTKGAYIRLWWYMFVTYFSLPVLK
jgi:hypothetical protein